MMDLLRLLSLGIFIGISCSLHRDIYPIENLEKLDKFEKSEHRKNEDLGVMSSVPYIRNKRSQTETPKEQECQENEQFQYKNPYACQDPSYDHVSHRCDFQCPGRKTGHECELHCTVNHSCEVPRNFTKEKCVDECKCKGNRDETHCDWASEPICMCLGLIVSVRDSPLTVLRSHFKNVSIMTNESDPLSADSLNLSNFTYLELTDISSLTGNLTTGLYTLKSLRLSNSNIWSSLTPYVFQDLSSLLSLDLSSNQINRLPGNVFHGLSSLMKLDLSNNRIIDLPDNIFIGLSDLTYLDLENNQITSLPGTLFHGLPSLAKLDLSYNKITFLPDNLFTTSDLQDNEYDEQSGLSDLPTDKTIDDLFTLVDGLLDLITDIKKDDGFDQVSALTCFDLSNNQITSLPDNLFDGLYALKYLNLSNNKITNLTDNLFDGISGLTSLDLSFNDIVNLTDNPLNGISGLTSLDLSTNKITALPDVLFDGLSALTRLHINNNLITALSNYILYGLYSLKELDLSNNRIVVLQDNLFSGVSALTYLDLSKNRISFLPGQTDELFEKTNPFDELSALTYLDLSNNEIRDLPADLFDGLSALSYLDLSNNGIRDLPEDLLDGLSVLSYLDLSNNEIMGLPGNLFYRLMDLSNDNPFDRQSALTYLHLKNNKIKEIPDHVFYGLFSLIKLDLSHNEITDLSSNLFDGLPALSYLHLENNQIRVLSKYIFGRLFNLSDLILDNNRLREFQENIFTGLHRLRNLSLINNGLTAFPRDSFEGLSRLEGIYLANNMLSALPVLPSSLSYLDISYNSFLDLPTGTFTNSSNLKFLNIVGNEVRVTEHIFQGLDQLLILLTDTPFMCCVKPESVDDDHCVKDLSEIEKCRYKDDLCYSDAISSCYDLIASNAQKMCLWIIGVFALIGNVFVILYSLYIAKHATTITTFSIFVLFLSISDCLMGIYLLIIGAADVRYRGVYSWNSQAWRESQICTLAGIIFNISSEMSTFLILSITIDRAFRTVFPMSLYSRKKISRKFAFAASGVLWLMSVVIAVIPAFPSKLYFKGEFYSQSGVCFTLPLTGDKQSGSEYSFAVFVCLNSFIFIVVALGEFCMFKSVKTSAGLMTQTRQLDIYVARVLFLVVATDFCCWLPIGIMGILAKGGYTIPDDAYGWVILFVLTINSAVNPLLNTGAIVWRQLVRASSWERQRLGRTSTGHQIRTDIEMNTLRLDVKNVNCL